MAQIGMGGFQAVARLDVFILSGGSSKLFIIPENCFAIASLSISSAATNNGTSIFIAAESGFNVPDPHNFFVSMNSNIVIDSNDTEFVYPVGRDGIYIPSGRYSLNQFGLVGGTIAYLSGTIFKNAPLVNQ